MNTLTATRFFEYRPVSAASSIIISATSRDDPMMQQFVVGDSKPDNDDDSMQAPVPGVEIKLTSPVPLLPSLPIAMPTTREGGGVDHKGNGSSSSNNSSSSRKRERPLASRKRKRADAEEAADPPYNADADNDNDDDDDDDDKFITPRSKRAKRRSADGELLTPDAVLQLLFTNKARRREFFERFARRLNTRELEEGIQLLQEQLHTYKLQAMADRTIQAAKKTASRLKATTL